MYNATHLWQTLNMLLYVLVHYDKSSSLCIDETELKIKNLDKLYSPLEEMDRTHVTKHRCRTSFPLAG